MTTNVEETKIVIPFGAVPKIESFGDFHDGRVVRLFEDRLVMSSQGGKEYSFRAAADANMCCDGICCRIQDLRIGGKIRLTTKKDEKNVAVKIESLNKPAGFAKAV